MGHDTDTFRKKLDLEVTGRKHLEYVENNSTRNSSSSGGNAIESSSSSRRQEQQQQQRWQETSLCLAPSMNGAGWGVFAARPFAKGEVVEIAPMFLRFLDEKPRVLKETILDNYHYEYWTWTGVTHVLNTMLSFGYTMYYNHGTNPNIEHRKWGIEPDLDNINSAVATGFFALRDIKGGEELINDYGGEEWFRARGLKLLEAPSSSLFRPDIDECIKSYRSRLCGGYGLDAFEPVLKWYKETDDLAPYDLELVRDTLLPEKRIGYGHVIAKESAKAGDTLEFGPALLLLKSQVCGTLLESIVVSWSDLGEEESLQRVETVSIQYQESDDVLDAENFQPPKTIIVPREDSVLLPLAGTIGLLRRSQDNPNAELHVTRDEHNENSFCFRVTATKLVKVGDLVVVDLPRRGNTEPLLEELACTGQPIVQGI